MELKLSILIFLLSVSDVWSDEFSSASNSFSASLYQKAVEGKSGNIIMSPVSIQAALSLAYFGSAGETENQMKSALNYGLIEKPKLLEFMKEFADNTKKSSDLQFANKIYVSDKYSVKPSFKEVAVDSFNSEVENVNFSDAKKVAKKVNKWVKARTNGKIKDVVDEKSISSSLVMMILNAVHFKAAWQNKFHDAFTVLDQFYLNDQDSVETKFMKHQKHYRHGEFKDLHFSIVELPFKNSDMVMMIFLPDSNSGLSQFEENLHKIDLNDISSKLTGKAVALKLPKFKINFNQQLREVLEKLGMGRIFTGRAEFPEFLTSPVPVYVSSVVHKAFIELDENGVEAAAVTLIEVSTSSLVIPRHVTEFNVNRPFFFALKTPTSTWFTGRVVNPTL